MIKIKKDQVYYINPYTKDALEVLVESPIPYLAEPIEIEEGTLLSDIFKILAREVFIFNQIFASQLGRHHLSFYIEDIRKPVPEDIKEDTEVDFLEVYWVCECCEYKDGDKKIEFYAGFHGWGKVDIGNEITQSGIAIELSPLSELKSLPIKITTETDIIKDEMDITHPETLFTGNKLFTVYDFIGAILEEISFFGSPEQRDAEWENIKEDFKDISSKIKNDE